MKAVCGFERFFYPWVNCSVRVKFVSKFYSPKDEVPNLATSGPIASDLGLCLVDDPNNLRELGAELRQRLSNVL